MNFFTQLQKYYAAITAYVPGVLLWLFVANGVLLMVLVLSSTLSIWSPSSTAQVLPITNLFMGTLVCTLALSVYNLLLERIPSLKHSLIMKAERFFIFFGFLGLYFATYTMVPALVFSIASVNRTTEVSLWYYALDQVIGVYRVLPSIIDSILSIPWLYHLLDVVYTQTALLLILFMFCIAFFSVVETYRYLAAISVAMFIAIPVWLVFPALAPLQLATTDSLGSEVVYQNTTAVRVLFADRSQTVWGESTDTWVQFWEEEVYEAGYGLAVSSNPSMHMAWALLILMFARRISRWLALVAGVLVLLEGVATIVFLQHYLIDIPCGLLVGAVSVWLVDRYIVVLDNRLQYFWFGPIVWLNQLGKFIGLVQRD